jgi:hypothetical protein
MDTFVVYLPNGEVLGAAQGDELNEAAEAVVNAIDWPDDSVVAKVNVARVTSEDYEVPDQFDMSDEGVEVEEMNLKVAIHD